MHAGTPRARLLRCKFLHFALLAAAVIVLAPAAGAQLSAYGSFTASRLAGGPAGDYLYGGTAGVLVDGPSFFHRLVPSANVQVRDVALNGERFLSASLGPRISVVLNKPHLVPYAEFLAGFGRYRSATTPGAVNTTDSLWQVNFGAAHPLNARLDVTAEYGYSQFGYNDGEYNPKHFSAGVIFHFVTR